MKSLFFLKRNLVIKQWKLGPMDTPNISKWEHGKKKATSPNSLFRWLFISVFPEYHLSLVHSYTTRRTAYCEKALALSKSPRSRCSDPDRETVVHRAVSDPCNDYPQQAQTWAVLHEAACVVLYKPFGCRTDSSSSLQRRILRAAAPRYTDLASCTASPLSNSAARCSHGTISSVRL